MILITGSNGHLGSETIDFLLQKLPGAELVGLVRDAIKGQKIADKGIDIRIGDYNDYGTLEKAMQGIDMLLFISSSDFEGRLIQHTNVIKAARNASVKHIFYTSIVQADKFLSPLSEDHFETENKIRESGINYTFFRNTFYSEYLPLFLGNAIEGGTWYFPSNGKKVNFALRTDMAEALANVILEPNKHINKTYEVTSAESYTLDEIADEITTIIGKEVNYIDLTIDAFRKQMMQEGLTPQAIMMNVGVGITFSNGALDYKDEALEKILERKPVDLKTFLHEYLSEKVPLYNI